MAGQTGKVTGSIRSLITDPTGAAISNATVQAHNLETGFERTAKSDSAGEYEVPVLPIGSYQVKVTAAGFGPYQQSGIRVELDRASPLNIQLQIGTAQQAVTVVADASILTTDTVDVSGNLNELSMSNLPITSRNTFNLALLVPGLNGSRDDELATTFAFGGRQRKSIPGRWHRQYATRRPWPAWHLLPGDDQRGEGSSRTPWQPSTAAPWAAS